MSEELRASEEKYAHAIQQIFSDKGTRERLERDPEGTLESLGFELDEEARQNLQQAKRAEDFEAGLAAVPAVVVRVATNGTRPAVSVVVRTSTFASTRGRSQELQRKK